MFNPNQQRLVAAEAQQGSSRARPLPDSVFEKLQTKSLLKRADKMRAFASDNEAFTNFLHGVEESLNRSEDRINPHVRIARDSTLANWAIQLMAVYPDLPREDYFLDTTVRKHAPNYLHLRLHESRGRDEEKPKATTVRTWTALITYCIGVYAHDREGRRVGVSILAREGLWNKLNNSAKQIIEDHKLNRFANERIRYGRRELKILIESCLKKSQLNGRPVKTQLILVMAFAFFMGCRPSTLAATAREFAEQERTLKLGDLRIFKESKFGFSIRVHLGNFKCHNEDIAKEQYWWLTSVSRAHNVLFDPGMWVICHLLMRGALYEETLEDVLNSDASEIAIRKEMLKKPLFLQATQGGKSLVEGKALMADAASAGVRAAAGSAGLPIASLTAFRRDAANFYTITGEKEDGALVLGHQLGNLRLVLEVYGQATASISAVRRRLEEESGPRSGPDVEIALNMNRYTSAAMQALVGRIEFSIGEEAAAGDEAASNDNDNDGDNEDGGRTKGGKKKGSVGIKVDPEELQRAKDADEAIQLLKRDQHEAWKVYIGHFSTRVRPIAASFKEHSNQVAPILDKCKLKDDSVNGFLAAQQAGERYVAYGPQITARGRYVRNRLHDHEVTKARRKNDMPAAERDVPTIAVRDEALRLADAPSALVGILAQASKAEAAAKATASTSTITGASSSASAASPCPPAPAAPPQFAPREEWESYARAVNNLERQADEDDLNKEVQKAIGKSMFANFKRRSLDGDENDDDDDDDDNEDADRPEPLAAEDVAPVVADDEHERHEPKIDENEEDIWEGVDIDDLRFRMAQYILGPELLNKAQEEQKELDGGKWICIMCKSFPHRKQNHAFPSKSNFRRHLASQHTAWAQLEMLMLTDDPARFICPARCGYKAGSIKAVRGHCLSDGCPGHEEYRAMESRHASSRHGHGEKRPEHRRTIQNRLLREAAGDSEDSVEGESIGDEDILEHLLNIGSSGLVDLARQQSGGQLDIPEDHYKLVFDVMQEFANGEHEPFW